MSHVPTDSAAAPEQSDVPLTYPQAHAAASVAGDSHLTMIVGPAGTGKTTALRAAVDQLQEEGRVVFGVAPSAAAADVLARETGVDADTVDKLLTEHSLERPPNHRYDLPAHSTVIVDEAGMLSTNKLDHLAQLADNHGWRVALVGDPMQFSAVGRGGMFEYLVDTHGAIELDRVHRFNEPWEREASLQLRNGNPDIADRYDTEGRLHGGTTTRMQSEALDAWATARANGETVILATPNNDTAHELNTAAQQRLIDAGKLPDTGRALVAGGHKLRPGDEIVTRRNDRQLETDQHQPIRNRDRWTIDTVHRNGDLAVHGQTGHVRLPSHYVQEHVQLGYAQTSHATQGRTVDRSILYLDTPTDAAGIYVPMTRGRIDNHAYIATTPETNAREIFADSITRNWIDQPAHARQAQLADQSPMHRPGTLAPDELRTLLDRQAAIENQIAATARRLDDLPREINWHSGTIGHKTTEIAGHQARLDAARESLAHHDRPFHRRGHEQQIHYAKQVVDEAPKQIDTITREIKEHRWHLNAASSDLDSARQTDTSVPLNTELTDIKARLGQDRDVRSRSLRTATPERVTAVVGARPIGGEPAQAWDTAAGHLDQHQNAFGLESGFGLPSPSTDTTIGYTTSRQHAIHASSELNRVGATRDLSQGLSR